MSLSLSLVHFCLLSLYNPISSIGLCVGIQLLELERNIPTSSPSLVSVGVGIRKRIHVMIMIKPTITIVDEPTHNTPGKEE